MSIFKKIYIKNINISDNEILQYAHNELTIAGHNKIYKYLNKMCFTNAYSISPQYILSTKTKKLFPFSTDLSWKSDVFETKQGILTGRYFNTCYLQRHHIINGWTPKPTINIDCVEIEIAPDNWIMAVDDNDLDLSYLSLSYDIQWKNCFCMKDIRLEDVTPELEKRAFEEIENNK